MFQPDSQSYAPDYALDLIKAWNMDLNEVASKIGKDITSMQALGEAEHVRREKMYFQLPEDVNVHVIDKADKLDKLLKKLTEEKFVGIDCEGFKSPQDDYLEPDKRSSFPCQWFEKKISFLNANRFGEHSLWKYNVKI